MASNSPAHARCHLCHLPVRASWVDSEVEKAPWQKAAPGALARICFACAGGISLLLTKIQKAGPNKQFLVQVKNHHQQMYQFSVPLGIYLAHALYYALISLYPNCTDQRQYLMRHPPIISFATHSSSPASIISDDDASFQIGLGAYEQGHYKTAKDIWEEIAKRGHAEAQFGLGCIYNKGDGVLQDYTEAAAWYRRAAKQGLTEAQYSLGWIYKNGEGVPQDYTKAEKWFRKAAEQGLAEAQSELGRIYNKGEGVHPKTTQKLKNGFEKQPNKDTRQLKTTWG